MADGQLGRIQKVEVIAGDARPAVRKITILDGIVQQLCTRSELGPARAIQLGWEDCRPAHLGENDTLVAQKPQPANGGLDGTVVDFRYRCYLHVLPPWRLRTPLLHVKSPVAVACNCAVSRAQSGQRAIT